MQYIGIDPGAKGAVAVLDDRLQLITAEPLPMLTNGEVDVAELYRNLWHYPLLPEPTLAIIEKVSAMPGQGVTSMFNFGRNVGELKATLKILKIPYVEITPLAWKKKVLAGLPWKAKNAADKKRAKLVAVTYVERRFPEANLRGPRGGIKDGVADAICLAIYGKVLDE